MKNSTKEINNEDVFLAKVFNHFLDISDGQCNIDNEVILSAESEMQSQILYGLLYLHEDIEDSKKELEQKIKEEYKLKLLKDKNRELEQFAYKASHDLKEPVRTIQSFTHLIKTKYFDGINPKALEFLEYIDQSARKMSELITYLLDFARFGNEGKMEQVNLQMLVQNLYFDLQSQLNKSNGQLIIGELYDVFGDPILLKLLFQNLTSNSLKYVAKDTAPVVKISSKCNDDGELEFCVEDNGIGMCTEDLSGIFDIFKRVKTDQDYEGSGIGLAHCKKIIDLHNGKIWAESKLGVGTKFYFTLKPASAEKKVPVTA